MTPPRQTARRAFLIASLGVVLAACERSGSGPSPAPAGPRQVVVYCSADAPIAQPVLDAFTKKTGIVVKPVFDTEATKTTGLVNRLLNEHQSGATTADVWWSSEPFGSIRLAQAGVLAPHISGAAENDFAEVAGEGWPLEMRASDGTWYGFARRVRVLIYNTRFVQPDDVPRDLSYLTEAKFKGRVGMARPEFGTTRGHMAALCSLGSELFRDWLRGVADNGLRLYDGNAGVARAVGSGELWLGLTDSDDALIAQANGWPVAFLAISNVPARSWHRRSTGSAGTRQEAFPEGSMQVPCTVAVLQHAPHPAEASLLVDFLLSRECEAMLAAGESHNLPTPRGLENTPAARLQRSTNPDPGPLAVQRWALSDLNLERAAKAMDEAMKICGEVLNGR
ncbi:MAG: extracellular solute-binding protein [Phycisphaerales bacterium]|nr:extracellular solute-binding protein [Phycisphaerales bacterium]